MSTHSRVEITDTLDRMIRPESPLRAEDKQKLLDALEAAAQALTQTPDGERS